MRFVTAYQKVFLLRGDLGARFFHLTPKKIVLENFAKFKRKNCLRVSFLIKLQAI